MPKNFGKVLVSVGSLCYGVMPVIVDLNESHLLNPEWMAHAKLHLAWLLATNSCLTVYSLYLIWRRSQVLEAAIIGLCVMSGFWIAASTKALYGGLFVDPNHEAPFILGLHPNVFSFIFVTGFLVVGLFVEYFLRRTERNKVVSEPVC